MVRTYLAEDMRAGVPARRIGVGVNNVAAVCTSPCTGCAVPARPALACGPRTRRLDVGIVSAEIDERPITSTSARQRCSVRESLLYQVHLGCAGFVPGWAWEAMQQALQVVDLYRISQA